MEVSLSVKTGFWFFNEEEMFSGVTEVLFPTMVLGSMLKADLEVTNWLIFLSFECLHPLVDNCNTDDDDPLKEILPNRKIKIDT